MRDRGAPSIFDPVSRKALALVLTFTLKLRLDVSERLILTSRSPPLCVRDVRKHVVFRPQFTQL